MAVIIPMVRLLLFATQMLSVFTKIRGILFVYSFLPILFFTLVSSCTSGQNQIPHELEIIDSMALKVPISLYSDVIGCPGFKVDFDRNKAYFFSGDDKSLITYDLASDTFSIQSTEVLKGRQHLFNFTVQGEHSFLLYFNPSYNGGSHDYIYYYLKEGKLDLMKLRMDSINVRTSYNQNQINYKTSTFLVPLRMEPIILKDSSVILACSYDKIPGTEEYSRLNRGQFIRLYPNKKGEYLPVSFANAVQEGEYFTKSLAQPFGLYKSDSMFFSYGISNDIYCYSFKTKKLTSINRISPLMPRLNSSDTLTDKWDDYDQHQFMDLIYNPLKKEYYRIVKLTNRAGYRLILMDMKFNEIGLYNIPTNIRWPFHYSKNGIIGYERDSYNLKKQYVFLEMEIK
jgi:hypothetical protein